MIDIGSLAEDFIRLYGKRPRIFSAPGRVNLIGEHTDYNQGFVLPIAIDRRTYIAAAANGTRQVCVHSFDLQADAGFSLNTSEVAFDKKWLVYAAGVALELQASGMKLSGADLAISSDVPIGAGLSSSAALEVSVAAALTGVSGQDIDAATLALVCQKAEHIYAGTKCGIMDQLTVSLAQKEHALLIDCGTLETKQIKLNLPETVIAICNTNVKHNLAVSAYNQRRQECEAAVEILRARFPQIGSLRDVDLATLEECASDLPDVLLRRARHIVTENARTIAAAAALEREQLEEIGALMYASHQSLRNDYEVSSAELDVMVELAKLFDGVIGARMTGGGFGGCTVNLVRTDRFEEFSEFIRVNYHSRCGIEATIYRVTADEGVNEMRL